MTLRKILTALVVLMGFVGIIFASYPFIDSLNPTETSLNKWKIEINLSAIKEGELREYIDALGRPIWVYHRTDEQIDWINNYSPVKPHEYVLEYADSEEFGGKYRSLDPEYFIFTEWRHRGKTYLKQERSWFSCGTIQYHSGDIDVGNSRIYKGAIACLQDHILKDYNYHAHIYDVTGMASYEYTPPLQVPYYELRDDGYIVVGPKP
ncbi:MAG: hypothetical protein JAY97_01690 [Candidatus Thiodiazotropha sp. 'RUGA']|nr:hypothetical protein [Candidatus Thiodiazotropha sp. 'RUGA']